MSFDLDSLADYELLEFFERLDDDSLLAFCNQPISKKVSKVCKWVLNKTKDAGEQKIIDAWKLSQEPRYIYNIRNNNFKTVTFTGERMFDVILTKASQVKYVDYIQGNITADSYDETLCYKLLKMPRDKLVKNMRFLVFNAEFLFNDINALKNSLYCAISGRDYKELTIWEIILAFILFEFTTDFQNFGLDEIEEMETNFWPVVNKQALSTHMRNHFYNEERKKESYGLI